jgi:hypothetical protein
LQVEAAWGGGMIHLRALKLETSNIQHPTPNIQWRKNWALDVRGWMFDVSVHNPDARFQNRGIIA